VAAGTGRTRRRRRPRSIAIAAAGAGRAASDCCGGAVNTSNARSRVYDTGGLRRTHLRGHQDILKRLLIHAGAFNLGLLMRQAFGLGAPRGLQAAGSHPPCLKLPS
jgi:hypothetical protein